MTTFISYASSTLAPFTAQVTLDGQPYNLVVAWNLFGRRPYISVVALDGTVVVTRGLTGSQAGVTLDTLSWSAGKAAAAASAPHGFRVATVAPLTISGASPAAYSGTYDCLITGPASFSYDLASNPGGDAVVAGAASFDIDLVSGLFTTSTLVFRAPSQQFEVSP